MDALQTSAQTRSIVKALAVASRSTGVDFDYLLKTAHQESSFNPKAVAKTSSARGLFQFIESSWLETLYLYGDRYGLEGVSRHISRNVSGKYEVKNRALREEILALRHNVEVSSMMAGALARHNGSYLGSKLDSAPSSVQLYLAHFLGSNGAVEFIKALQTAPNKSAASLLPKAAGSNPDIFYDKLGNALSIRQSYNKIEKRYMAEIQMPASYENHIASLPVKKPVSIANTGKAFENKQNISKTNSLFAYVDSLSQTGVNDESLNRIKVVFSQFEQAERESVWQHSADHIRANYQAESSRQKESYSNRLSVLR